MNQQFASIDIVAITVFLVICIGVAYFIFIAPNKEEKESSPS